MLIRFGKYKGQDITLVPLQYLLWIMKNATYLNIDDQKMVLKEVARRHKETKQDATKTMS